MCLKIRSLYFISTLLFFNTWMDFETFGENVHYIKSVVEYGTASMMQSQGHAMSVKVNWQYFMSAL